MFQDYRQAIKEVFFERRSRNASYSLRAFARDLGVPAPNLSMILKNKKGMTILTAQQISKRLGLSSVEQILFCNLVEKEHARSQVARIRASQEVNKQQILKSNIAPAVWEIIGSWHYFALVELIRIKTQDQKASALASALGISPDDVRDAIQKLLSVGLIKKQAGKLHVVNQFNISPDGIPSEVTRKGHARMLDKAKEAVFSQSTEERDFTYTTFGLDPLDIPEARKEIRSFIQNFLEKYSNKTTAQQVYTLSTQLFNLTPTLKGKKL